VMEPQIGSYETYIAGASDDTTPRGLLGQVGQIVIAGLYAPILDGSGSALLMPTRVTVSDELTAPNDPPPATTIDLRGAFTTKNIDVLPAEQRYRLVTSPPENKVEAPLFRVGERKTKRATILLYLNGQTLLFGHRGRTVSFDLQPYAGRAIDVIARWNPMLVSLEVRSDRETLENSSLPISFGTLPVPEKNLVRVSDGQLASPAPEWTAATSPNWCAGLVIFERPGTGREESDPLKRLVASEASEIDMSHVARSSINDVARSGVGAMYFFHVEVDNARFERWRAALRLGAASAGTYEIVLVRYPLTKETMESALSVVAYCVARSYDQFAECGDLAPLWPPPMIDARDLVERACFHAFAQHYLVDSVSLRRRAELAERVADLQRAQRRITLGLSALPALWDAAGRDWIAGEVSSLDGTSTGQASFALLNPIKEGNRNLPVESFRLFQRDVSLSRDVQSSAAIDLWTEAVMLATDVDLIQRKMAATPAELEERLRSTAHAAMTTAFEVDVLADLLRLGHRASFVPTGEERSPDIVVDHAGRQVYVECSRKEQDSVEFKVAKSHAAALIVPLEAHGRKRLQSLVVDLRYLRRPSAQQSAELVAAMKAAVANGVTDVGTTITRDDWTMIIRDLGDWRRVWRIDTVYSLVPGATWIAAKGRQFDWSVVNHVCALTMVAVSLEAPRRILLMVEKTLKDKAKVISRGGQVPDGAPFVCAISLGLLMKGEAEGLIAACGSIVKTYSALSALVLYWSERACQDFIPTHRTWFAYAIPNPAASVPLPLDFRIPHGELHRADLTGADALLTTTSKSFGIGFAAP
jgi:hypothetical protein